MASFLVSLTCTVYFHGNFDSFYNFITHYTTFDKAKEEFPSWLNADNGVIKAIVEMD